MNLYQGVDLSNAILKRSHYILALLVWLVYISLSLFAPMISGNQYNLTPTQLALLKLTIAIPLLLIWLTAVHGLVAFRRYVNLIKDSTDGWAYAGIYRGLVVLVASIMITAIIGQLRPYFYQAGYIEALVIFNNYLQIALPLLAFYLMHQASGRLIAVVGAKKTLLQQLWLFGLFAALAPIYTWLVFSNPNRTTPTTSGVVYASNYLSDPMILITVVMPYLVVWALGISTIQNIRQFSLHVKGRIYKSALKRLTNGLVAVILLSVILQLLAAVSGTLAHYQLSSILILVYAILIIYAVAYVNIARGALSLTKIEEVK